MHCWFKAGIVENSVDSNRSKAATVNENVFQFLPRDAMLAKTKASVVKFCISCHRVCLSVRPSVCPSVCHKSELYKDG